MVEPMTIPTMMLTASNRLNCGLTASSGLRSSSIPRSPLGYGRAVSFYRRVRASPTIRPIVYDPELGSQPDHSAFRIGPRALAVPHQTAGGSRTLSSASVRNMKHRVVGVAANLLLAA